MPRLLPRLCLLLLTLLPGTARGECAAPPSLAAAAEVQLPRPPSGRVLLGWLHRQDSDGSVELNGVSVPMWPERGGRLPLHLAHDGAPLTLRWQGRGNPGERLPRLALHCVAADDPLARRFAERMALARMQGELDRGKDRPTGVWLSVRLWLAGWQERDDFDAWSWLAGQRILLAQRAERSGERAEFADQLRARALARGERLTAAHAALEIGMALYLQDRPRAQQALREARSEFAELGEGYFSALAQHDLCLQRRLDGALDQALHCYAGVIAEHRALGETESVLRTQLNRTTALGRSGRHREAYAQLDEAAALIEQIDNRELAASVSRLQAQYLRWRGDFEGALARLQPLRAEYESAFDPVRAAQTDSLIGLTFSLAGEPARAVEYFRHGEQRLAGTDHAWQRANLRLATASALMALERYDDALDAARHAAAELESAGDAMLAQSVWLAQAEIQLRRGDAAAAARALAAMPGSLKGSQRLQRALLAAELGREAADTVDWAAELDTALATDQLLLALKIGERRVLDLQHAGQDAAAMAQARRLLRHAAPVVAAIHSPHLRDALLGQLHRLVAALLSGRPAGRLASQQGDALRGLLVELARAGLARARDDLDQDLLLALEKQIGSELGQAGSQPSGAPRSLLLSLVGHRAAGAPGEQPAASRSDPAPPLRLAADQRLALPLLGAEASGLLVFDGRHWAWWPVDAAALRRLRQSLPALLASGHAAGETVDAQVAALRHALGADRWLDDQVRTVWLGAHRELSSLPVELALHAEGPFAVGWVLSPEPLAAARASGLHLLGVSAAGEAGLSALAEVPAELREVAASWSALGAPHSAWPASRAQLVGAVSRPGAVVHIASHGRGSATRFEESGLWMAGSGNAADFVSAYRLRSLPVQAGLVVLSSCESGSGAGQVGTSLGGVAAALGEAGAAAVVGTRWPIADRAARSFSAAFHAAHGGAGVRVEQSLLRARAELKAQPALRNPTHWAGWFALFRGVPQPAGEA